MGQKHVLNPELQQEEGKSTDEGHSQDSGDEH